MTEILLAWSGGKDAAWTLHHLRARDDVRVVGLLTTVTADHDRVAMHGIRRDVLHGQAAAVGLPLLESSIRAGADNDAYEAAFAGTLREARERWPGLDTIAYGDLKLADVRAWREALCRRHGWKITTPLFGADTRQLAREMIVGGLQPRLCCVDTTQLDARYAGRRFDA
ncbi:ATP-binding protein, partial [Bacillus tequilensis]|nr:ATP-binding protein [Bacillus tequilensis]